MVSRDRFRHRVPMLASWGNQSRKAAMSPGTNFLPGEEAAAALAVDRRDQVRQEVVSILPPATIWVRATC